MNEKILSILIPICGVYSTFGMAGELYFPNSMDVISSAEDAQYWFADNYSLLSGSKKVPNIKFDKVTEGANSIQYRFYQDFPKAQECVWVHHILHFSFCSIITSTGVFSPRPL